MGNPRYANGHRRRLLRARVLAAYDTCGICGHPVDKTLPHGLPGSPEVDEIMPVSRGGDPFAWANVQLTHRRPLQSAQVEQGRTRPARRRLADYSSDQNVTAMVTTAEAPLVDTSRTGGHVRRPSRRRSRRLSAFTHTAFFPHHEVNHA